MAHVFVTTIKRPGEQCLTRAHEVAKQLGVPYIKRDAIRLNVCTNSGSAVLVMENCGPALHTAGGVHRFHLNMAALRIINLKRGQTDNMLTALALQPRYSLLDCTLGLVAQWSMGACGRVVGLESSVLVHYVTSFGLRHFECEDVNVNLALRAICTVPCDYRNYLQSIPDESYDVIYFDPMFERPQHASSSFHPLRGLVCNDTIDDEVISLAKTKARQRVVVKHEKNSAAQLRYDDIIGGKYSAVRYGVHLIRRSE